MVAPLMWTIPAFWGTEEVSGGVADECPNAAHDRARDAGSAVDVGGPDGGGKSVVVVVGDEDGLLLRLVRQDAENRRKHFLAVDLCQQPQESALAYQRGSSSERTHGTRHTGQEKGLHDVALHVGTPHDDLRALADRVRDNALNPEIGRASCRERVS